MVSINWKVSNPISVGLNTKEEGKLCQDNGFLSLSSIEYLRQIVLGCGGGGAVSDA